MIHAHDLHVSFRHRTVLDGLGLDVTRGERLAIVGLNGAGKTTLFRGLLGLAPYRGTLTVGGLAVRDHIRSVRRMTGYVPQRPPTFAGTLDAFVTFIADIRGTDPTRARRQLDALGLPLETFGPTPVVRLSGGMVQKALLGLALAGGSELLLLDEPTANLDARTRRELLHTIQRVSDTTTVVLASHRVDDIEAIADRVVILNDGKIVFDDSTATLRRRFASAVTVRLDIPEPDRAAAGRALDTFSVTPLTNGAFSVSVQDTDVADVIYRIRQAGITVGDVHVERPALTHTLERVLEDQ